VPHQIIWSWYTGRWWVGCHIWYSEEGRGRSPPRPLLDVLNVTAHPSTASVPITVLLYNTLSQKNAPTLASCSFDKHRLILIIFGTQHQHTFRNDTRVQLSLSLHFYLLYLLLNSCDGNDAFWRSPMLVKQSSSFSREHRTLSLQICVRQTVRLTTEFVDWCRNVLTLYKHLSAIPAAVTSDLKHITKRHRQSSWSKEKAITWTSAKLKPALFRANTLCNRLESNSKLFSEPPIVNTLLRVISVAAI